MCMNRLLDDFKMWNFTEEIYLQNGKSRTRNYGKIHPFILPRSKCEYHEQKGNLSYLLRLKCHFTALLSLPWHKISYPNVPMSSIKIKITPNGISPTHCFSCISSRRAAVCKSMEACAVSFVVADQLTVHMSSLDSSQCASKETICACVQRVLRCSLAKIFHIESYRKHTISQNLLAWPS